MESDLSLLEIAVEDDSLLQQIPIHDISSFNSNGIDTTDHTSPYFMCSPLQVPRSNPIATEGSRANDAVEDMSRSFHRDSTINKENFNQNKEEGMKLSLEPQQMKRKKKGGVYNLRKSLAWDRAFFTEEGVLDPVELSMISGNVRKFSGETLLTIREEDTSCAGASLNQRALEENLFTELPATTSGKHRKSSGSSFFPKNDSPVRKKAAPTSSAKRNVLSAHDVNRSASKRSDCPRPVASSSLKRPANLITMKTSAKDSKVSRLPVPKPNHCASIKISKSSTLGASESKRNQITRPAVNIQKNSGLKGSSSNIKNALNNSKAGPTGNSLTTKTSLGQAKRNVASSVKCSTNLQYPLKTEVNNDLDVIFDTSLLHADLGSNSHDGGSSRTAIPLPKNANRTGVNVQPTQVQTAAKPSGLRMPSPSLGFFGQSKLPPMQSPLKMTSPPCNLPESNISNLRKFGAPPNPVFELRPPLAPRSLPEKIRDGSLAGNVKASCSSFGCSVLTAVNPTLCGVVESNSQVANRQMEKMVQCNDTSYKAIKTLKQLHVFVGVDEHCPGQAGPPTTAIKFSIEDVKLQTNDGNLLLKEASQLDKDNIDTKVVDNSQKNKISSELEIPQLKTHSSSAVEVTGLSHENDISDHQLGEERPFDPSHEDHGVALQVNPVCKANEPVGEQAEAMHSFNCKSGPFSSDNQMLEDNAADISSQVEDYNVAEIENSHAFSHFRSIELEKEDYDISSELNSQKCDINEPCGIQTKMMNSLNCIATPILSDAQMLQDNAADIILMVQGYNTAEIENSPTFSRIRSVEQEQEVHGVSSKLNCNKRNVDEPFAEEAETYSISSDSQMPWDNAADISSEVQDYNTAEIENFLHLRFIEHENEASTAIDELRKQLNVEDRGMQSGNRTDRNSNGNISISANNDHKMVIDDVIEKPDFLEFPKSPLTREDTLQDEFILQVDGSLLGDKSIFPDELKQENALQSDEIEVTDVCQTELRSSRTSSMPDFMLHCESNAAPSVQCHLLEDSSSVSVGDSKPVAANCNLNTHAQLEVGFHDQSTSVELGNMDEDNLAGAVDAEDVNVTCQKVGNFGDSEQENLNVTCEPSFVVQVESDYSMKNKIEHVDVEVKKFNLSVESSHRNFDSQPGDELCPCDENSSIAQMYMLESKNDDNDQGDQVKQITPCCLCETKVICNDKKESLEAPSLSFDNSHSLEEPQIMEDVFNPIVSVHDGSGSRSPGLSLHKDMNKTFKESEGGYHIIKEQDGNFELQNPVNQSEEVSSTSFPEDEGVTGEHCSEESGIDKKQDVLVIKPPLNATPFSDEWLAAFEAAGEEILTMKSGAVQNSPEEKSQREPGPWSPVKRKQNQAIGPYDCTKYTNTNS